MRILSAFLLFSILFFNFDQCNAQTASWTPLAPALFPTNVSGQIHGISRVSEMKFHPTNSSKMYAVSARGGLFISSNGGTSWSLAPGCDAMANGTRMASVCVDFTNDQVIYLGGGDANYYSTGSGVWKSVNGGTSFTQTSLNTGVVVEILMDPGNNNILVAATSSGIYKTTNGGTSWTLKSGSIAFYDLVQKANASSRVLFASGTNTLWRSNDFGETWTQVTNGVYLPAGYTNTGARIAVTPADSNYVYFALVAKFGTVFRSTDGGNSFAVMKDTVMPNLTGYSNTLNDVGQGNYNFAIGADRTNRDVIWLVAHNVWKSTNGGASWTQQTNWWQKVHTDMHQIVVSPYNTSQLWNMNDGGVWLSTDGGDNWTPKSDGIYGYEIYHGYTSPTRRDAVSIGTQDNGELYSANAGWYCNRGGDWSSAMAFDCTPNSSRIYYYSNAKRRDVITGGENTYGLVPTSLQDIAFTKSNPDLAFAGNLQVYRTTNLTATTPSWTQIGNINKTIMAMHINLADSNRLYVITNDQNIYISTNALSATPTFSQVTLPNATNSRAGIASVKGNPDILYAVMNTRVYRSTNNGTTWTNISTGLPSVNWNDIVIDETFPAEELVFVAASNSVYYKKAASSSWTNYSSGLPARTNINDITIFENGTNQALLRVSTYGRGMWETPFENLRPLQAVLGADKTDLCPGGSVQFTDLSTGVPTSRAWSFPGGSPSSSTAVNPLVMYSTPGKYAVTLTVSNGSGTSSTSRTGFINTQGKSMPLTETMEGSVFPPTSWSLFDDGADQRVWTRYGSGSSFGVGFGSAVFDNWNYNAQGKRDELRTPPIDLTEYSTARLIFDVAYQLYYNAAYVDSLLIKVATNCGTNFQTVYLKPGPTLATIPTIGTSAYYPAAGDWRTDTVNLNPFAGQGNVIASFVNIGRYGNFLYIDKVRVEGDHVPVNLQLKTFIQGFYLGANQQAAALNPTGAPTVCDSITVLLASPTSPYAFTDTIKALLMTNGTVTATFPGKVYGNQYYIVLRHRNALETWSAVPVTLDATNVSYDFTLSAAKAYGNNQQLIGGVATLFSGDVNQDGLIEATDYATEENDIVQFLFGYKSTDLTGDQLVEASDYSLIENNLLLFLFTARP
jgi:PKD repeat protein